MDIDTDIGEINDGPIIGDPEGQAGFWEVQSTPDSCAVVSQVSLLHQFDVDISQDDALFECEKNGWYISGEGTPTWDVGRLMEAHGVETHSVHNANLSDLVAELQQGHGVIVNVNSAELWDQGLLEKLIQWFCDTFGLDNSTFNPADHAVVVTGIDVSDADNPQIIINDSGDPKGCAHPYPLARFADAWQNSNFSYTATDEPLRSGITGDLDSYQIGKFLVELGVAGGTLFLTEDPASSILMGQGAGVLYDTAFGDEDFVRDI